MKTIPDFWFEPYPWIDGQWHPGGETVAVQNPATRETIAQVSRADAATVRRAIEGAVKAQREWREVSAVERGLILKRTAALLLARMNWPACSRLNKASHTRGVGVHALACSVTQGESSA